MYLCNITLEILITQNIAVKFCVPCYMPSITRHTDGLVRAFLLTYD